MVDASPPRPAPSATGTLADRPLLHLLVYARNRRLTGALEFSAADGRSGAVELWRGRVTSARTAPPVAYFGTVAYELGLIDTPMLDATLLEIATTKRLHGEVLIERRAITPLQRDEVLAEQACRKIHHLFSLPAEARFDFYDTRPAAEEPPLTLDPIAPAWRGLRDYPRLHNVDEILNRFSTATLHLVNEGPMSRVGLSPEERDICTSLAARPMTIAQMRVASRLPSARVDLVIYLLILTKCAEPGEAASPFLPMASTTTSSGSMPAARAQHGSGSMPAAPAHHPSGEMPTVTLPVTVPLPAPGSRPNLPAARISSGSMRAVTVPLPAPGSRPNLPAARISSGSMAAVTVPLPAPGSRPNMPAMPTTTLTPGAPRVSDSGEVRRSLSFRVPSVSAMKAVAGSSPKIAAQVAQHFGPADVGASGIAHRAQSLASEDFFEALGLPDGASVEAARAAYYRLAKLWHPDRLPEDLAAFTAEVNAIFDHMTRAHATLTDADARSEYLVTREKDPVAAAAARAEDAAFAARPRNEIVREIEQAITKRDLTSAAATAQRVAALDPEDADAQALIAWIATVAGEGPEETLAAALPLLDAAIKLDAYCERAHYYRGVLHKRLGNGTAAFRDFTRTLQMNPKHVDAEREVRIMEMRARKGSGERALDVLVSKAKKK
jgi:hypothetical protein